MPIQLNQLSDSGLAQFAGNRVGSLNLPLADKSPMGEFYKAWAEGQQLQANRQNQMDIAQLQSGTQFALGSNRIKADIALKQYEQQQENNRNAATIQSNQQIAQGNQGVMQNRVDALNNRTQMMGQNDQVMQGLRQQEVNQQGQNYQATQQNEQNKTAIEALKTQMLARSKLDDKQLQQRGAAAGTLATLWQDPARLKLDPTTQNQMANEDIKRAHDNGYIDDDEFKKLTAMDIKGKTMAAIFDMRMTGHAEQYKDVISNQNKQQALTEQNKTQQQAIIANSQQQQQQFANMDKKYNDSFFTTMGNVKQAVGEQLGRSPQWVQSAVNMIPGVNVNELKQFGADYNQFFQDVKRVTLTSLQNLKGVRVNKNSMDIVQSMLPQPGDSPDLAKQKYQDAKNIAAGAQQLASQLLAKGVPSDQIDDQVNSFLQAGGSVSPAPQQSSQSTNKTTPGNINYVQKGQKFSDADIAKIAEHNKVSIADVKAQLGQ